MSRGSRFGGIVVSLGITGMALMFLAFVVDETRNIVNPSMPIAAVIAAGALFFGLLRGPVGQAIARMLEGSSADDDSLRRIADMEAQVQELSLDQHRVEELEERLEFAERLLARRDAEQPPQIGDR